MKHPLLAVSLSVLIAGASDCGVSAQNDFIAQASDKSWSTSDWQPSGGSLLPVGAAKKAGTSAAASQDAYKPLLPLGNASSASSSASMPSRPAQNGSSLPSSGDSNSVSPSMNVLAAPPLNTTSTPRLNATVSPSPSTTFSPSGGSAPQDNAMPGGHIAPAPALPPAASPVAPSGTNVNANSSLRSRFLPALQQAASRAAQRYGNVQGGRPFNQSVNGGSGGYNPQFNPGNTQNQIAPVQNPVQRDFSRSAVPPGALVDGKNTQLNYAQQFEEKGEWFQAAQYYSNALRSAGGDLTQADIQAANRNHTSGVAEMFKRMASDPRQREIGKHMAHCNCMLLNERYSGKTGNTDLKFTEDAEGKSYFSMENSEPNNGKWCYLAAVYWTGFTNTSEYNYVQAMVHLNKAMACSEISPSIKQKVVALRHYIFPAFLLQLKDMDRAKFDRMMGIVHNVEHPTITLYTDRAGTVVSKFDSRQTLDTAFYGLCKEMLKNDYPTFINNYNALVQHCRSLPNKGMAVPGGAGSAELSEYCPNHWEEKAFGPLDFRVGRL